MVASPGSALTAFIAFVLLVFLCMMLIDIAPYISGRRREATGRGYNPNVLVIVPCRGVDFTLGQNLRSIASQDYPKYKAIAVVDATSDPAVPYIRKAGMECIVSRYRNGSASGKVMAIIAAIRKYPGYQAYAIADSDILAGRRWLADLVAPLADRRVGISTTFPKFVPMGGFWSKVKLIWGFAGEGMMESRSTRFGWGGSLAFRKDLLTPGTMGMLQHSRYSVSDDICLTRAAKGMGMGIAYVKSAQPVVNSNDSFGAFWEWAKRQTALSIMGYRRNLYYGISYYSAEVLLFVSAFALSILVSPLFLVLLAHFLKSEMKTYRRAGIPDPAIAAIVAIMPALYLVGMLLASRARSITWRGRKYGL